MKLTINGEITVINDKSPISIDTIIKRLGHPPQLIVIELNGMILEREMWGNQSVKDGDKLEIVTIVGGGS